MSTSPAYSRNRMDAKRLADAEQGHSLPEVSYCIPRGEAVDRSDTNSTAPQIAPRNGVNEVVFTTALSATVLAK